MSDSEPPTKRPRANAVSSTLRKPFRSPLKRTEELAPSTHAVPFPTSIPAKADHPNNAKLAIACQRQDLLTPRKSQNPDAQHHQLQSSQLSNQSQARQTRAISSDLDTIQQAIKLLTPKSSSVSSSPRLEDDTLHSLIKKWRGHAREIAEQLYGATHDKINRMGGMEAWREKERQKTQRMEEWRREDEESDKRAREDAVNFEEDDPDEITDECADDDSQLGEMSKTERREIKAMRKQAKQEAKESARDMASLRAEEDSLSRGVGQRSAEVKKEEMMASVERDNEDGFTMGVMLRTMGIDFALVGWDRDMGRWIE